MGAVRGGTGFGKGALAYLLRNRIYLGEIRHQGRTYPGEHEPIIDRELFEAVQTKLAAQAQAHRQARAGSDALLLGRIFDDRGPVERPQTGRPVPLLRLGSPDAGPARGGRIRSARAGARDRATRPGALARRSNALRFLT